jgi:16S rRNA (guanine966-N2)-methyltransferase
VRIITGKHKGMQLKTVPGEHTRPTMDRVRESLFSILGSFGEGANVLDLFAGSGSLGLEALSRGASSVTFVESNRTVADVLRFNVEKTGSKSCTILQGPVERVVPRLGARKQTFDLVFMDPPYRMGKVLPTLQILVRRNLLSPAARVVVEHEKSLRVPVDLELLFRADQRKYGDTQITFYAMLAQEV